MKKLTVFTPTYNRAYCLFQNYQSLIRQSNKAFIWLIIDDGSTDDTKDLVKSWINEDEIEIQYHYQENQGMHGAHNTAYSMIKTELNVCIDSDDFMPDNAVKKILDFWSDNNNEKDNVAGFVGLDSFKNGKIIGSKIPPQIKQTTLEDLYHLHKIPGDKKLVLRTKVVNEFPKYPIFKNERFVPLGTLYLMIDKKYKLLCLNEVLCVVEYMEDGSSKNIFKQYLKNPRGFIYAREVAIKNSNFFIIKVKNNIHFISHCIYLKDWKQLFKSHKPIMTFILLPFGVILYTYIKLKLKQK